MNCQPCHGTGLKNLEQLEEIAEQLGVPLEESDPEVILAAIDAHPEVEHDICACDCCGDGEGWYGEPGSHYGSEDLPGRNGPYGYNGGLCECH